MEQLAKVYMWRHEFQQLSPVTEGLARVKIDEFPILSH